MRLLKCCFTLLISVTPSLAQSVSAPAPAIRAHALFVSTSAQLLKDMNRDKALAGYKQVVQIDPNYAPAWFNIGVLYEAAGKWTDARIDFQKYLAISPEGPYAGRAQRELNVITQRLKQPALTTRQRYDAAIARARALSDANFNNESIDEAALAQAMDPSRWEAYAIVSLVMYKLHRDFDGKRFAEMALQRAPDDKKDSIAKALAPQP